MPSVHRESSEQEDISGDSFDLEPVVRMRGINHVEGDSDDFNMVDIRSDQAPRSSVLGERTKGGRTHSPGRAATLSKNRPPSNRPLVRRLALSSGRWQDEHFLKVNFPSEYLDNSQVKYHPSFEGHHRRAPEIVEASLSNTNC
jgi:hypothetical protein